jgi:hypothetical protein
MSSANRDPNIPAFAYHAQAVGLSASLTKPCCENIPSLATASLSMTGGESYSTVLKYNWKGLISFDEASAYATGSMDHGAHNTLSTVTVKNLNIANMVHADLVVARVTSKHLPKAPEAEVTFTGSMIRNLVIAGKEIDIVIDDKPFNDNPTYAALSKELSKCRPQSQTRMDSDRGIICGSLATKVGDQEGFTITIPEFGTIYVAHVLVKASYRRVSMLRFELGCPIGGMLEAGGGETNGVEYWP